jgi:hypothetical protein
VKVILKVEPCGALRGLTAMRLTEPVQFGLDGQASSSMQIQIGSGSALLVSNERNNKQQN